ncbi:MULTISPECIES: hypothetical protein [Amycolatopsis]|uniref:Secreted protein n=1 Tax=Amycolatopsis albidoflavus TaxID=102226 RepID=A0ABW5IF13_9PSEU
MLKPSRITTAVLAGTGAVLITTAPALADSAPLVAVGPHAADNWNFAVCACPVPLTGGQEIAAVPVLAPYAGKHHNAVSVDGNVLEHAALP